MAEVGSQDNNRLTPAEIVIALACAAGIAIPVAVEACSGEPEPNPDNPAETIPDQRKEPHLRNGVLYINGTRYQCVTRELVKTEPIEDDNGNVTAHMSSSLPSNEDYNEDRESCKDDHFGKTDPSYPRVVAAEQLQSD